MASTSKTIVLSLNGGTMADFDANKAAYYGYLAIIPNPLGGTMANPETEAAFGRRMTLESENAIQKEGAIIISRRASEAAADAAEAAAIAALHQLT